MSHQFNLEEAVALLSRTPGVLRTWLVDLPAPWIAATEGAGTWSPFDVVGHLIQGEQTDWMRRTRHLLEHGATRAFEPFDREAQFEASKGRPLPDLLDEFARLRASNLEALAALRLTEADLERVGRHPAFGEVTLRQLLATWVAHDCDHVMQIARTMASRYAHDVGPWRAYLRIISGKPSA